MLVASPAIASPTTEPGAPAVAAAAGRKVQRREPSAVQRGSWFFANAARRDEGVPDQGGGLALGMESGSKFQPGFVVYGGYYAPILTADDSPLLQLRTVPLRAMGTARLLTSGRFALLSSAGLATTLYEQYAKSGHTRHLSLQPAAVGMRWSVSGALLAQYRIASGVELLFGGMLDYGKACERLVLPRSVGSGLPASRFSPALLTGAILEL